MSRLDTVEGLRERQKDEERICMLHCLDWELQLYSLRPSNYRFPLRPPMETVTPSGGNERRKKIFKILMNKVFKTKGKIWGTASIKFLFPPYSGSCSRYSLHIILRIHFCSDKPFFRFSTERRQTRTSLARKNIRLMISSLFLGI